MRKYEFRVDKSLLIRSWEGDDASELFELVEKNREILKKWLHWIPEVKTEKDSKKFIVDSKKDYEKLEAFEMGLWENGKLIGCLGIHGVDKQNRKASLGYWLSKDSQGKGIMTKSLRRLVRFGFEELDLNRIDLLAGAGNAKSRAIAKRLGFSEEGILRDYEYVEQHFINLVVYSFLSKEYRESKA